jgi:hypothetical protein
MEEEIRKYLKKNLSIEVEVLTDYDYDTKTQSLEVTVKLDNETIASDSTYLS